jgi:hypothetical protein
MCERIQQFRRLRNFFVLDLFLNLNGPQVAQKRTIAFSNIAANKLTKLPFQRKCQIAESPTPAFMKKIVSISLQKVGISVIVIHRWMKSALNAPD